MDGEGAMLFKDWLALTRELQETAYGVDYSTLHSDEPDGLRALIDYARWNMLAIDDELAEMRQGMSWKPWQHDDPYVDRTEVVKEAIDVLHFVANIVVACGATDDDLNLLYAEKMERNRQRQLDGYRVKDTGVKCRVCARAIDDVGANPLDPTLCAKCEAAA